MKILQKYKVCSEGIEVEVEIKRVKDFVPYYELKLPEIAKGTLALLDKVRADLLAEIPLKMSEITDMTKLEAIKKKFYEKCFQLLKKELPFANSELIRFLTGTLIQEMFGLGRIEFLIEDPNLEEVVINGSKECVWVYHKKYGWLKTNVFVQSENDILNYANSIGRKVGRQITILNPFLDAHLPTGDRVNATLFPISTCGNTLTIRKFRRSPWTITDLIENRTLNFEVSSLLWLAIQYELNVIFTGGTASGKTSLLNVFATFIPPNQRIISIEDTRELQLPDFLHWIPLTTREPNPEGLGEVSMLQLLVNSLRMRPDRIIVGEIRRAEEAEVLFEAMHTGHSVYATLHADTAELAYRRLVNPPINVPENVVSALHLFAVAFRDRKLGIRRLLQLAELIPTEKGAKINVLYQWKPEKDVIEKENESYRVLDEISMHTGLTLKEIEADLKEKQDVLKWFVKNEVKDIDKLGRLIAIYYCNKDFLLKQLKSNNVDEIIRRGLE
jgi:flagellar protein FlaI